MHEYLIIFQHGLISYYSKQKIQVAKKHIQSDTIYIKVNSKQNLI